MRSAASEAGGRRGLHGNGAAGVSASGGRCGLRGPPPGPRPPGAARVTEEAGPAGQRAAGERARGAGGCPRATVAGPPSGVAPCGFCWANSGGGGEGWGDRGDRSPRSPGKRGLRSTPPLSNRLRRLLSFLCSEFPLWLETQMASNERDAISWYQKKVMAVFYLQIDFVQKSSTIEQVTFSEFGNARYCYMSSQHK